MKEWERRLTHERAIRDCHVYAGNIPVQEPDPENSIQLYKVRRFNGPAFWIKMKALGHTSSDFNLCSCRK